MLTKHIDYNQYIAEFVPDNDFGLVQLTKLESITSKTPEQLQIILLENNLIDENNIINKEVLLRYSKENYNLPGLSIEENKNIYDFLNKLLYKAYKNFSFGLLGSFFNSIEEIRSPNTLLTGIMHYITSKEPYLQAVEIDLTTRCQGPVFCKKFCTYAKLSRKNTNIHAIKKWYSLQPKLSIKKIDVQKSIQEHPIFDIDKNIVFNTLDSLKKLAIERNNPIELRISGGGEPLLHKDIVEIFNKIKEINKDKKYVSVTLITNGHQIFKWAKNKGQSEIAAMLESIDNLRISSGRNPDKPETTHYLELVTKKMLDILLLKKNQLLEAGSKALAKISVQYLLLPESDIYDPSQEYEKLHRFAQKTEYKDNVLFYHKEAHEWDEGKLQMPFGRFGDIYSKQIIHKFRNQLGNLIEKKIIGSLLGESNEKKLRDTINCHTSHFFITIGADGKLYLCCDTKYEKDAAWGSISIEQDLMNNLKDFKSVLKNKGLPTKCFFGCAGTLINHIIDALIENFYLGIFSSLFYKIKIENHDTHIFKNDYPSINYENTIKEFKNFQINTSNDFQLENKLKEIEELSIKRKKDHSNKVNINEPSYDQEVFKIFAEIYHHLEPNTFDRANEYYLENIIKNSPRYGFILFEIFKAKDPKNIDNYGAPINLLGNLYKGEIMPGFLRSLIYDAFSLNYDALNKTFSPKKSKFYRKLEDKEITKLFPNSTILHNQNITTNLTGFELQNLITTLNERANIQYQHIDFTNELAKEYVSLQKEYPNHFILLDLEEMPIFKNAIIVGAHLLEETSQEAKFIPFTIFENKRGSILADFKFFKNKTINDFDWATLFPITQYNRKIKEKMPEFFEFMPVILHARRNNS